MPRGSVLSSPPVRRRAAAYERLRQKIAEDIVDVIKESGSTIAEFASFKMGISQVELKRLIYEEDLKLSELVDILDKIDADFYPLIRPRYPMPADEPE